MIFVVHPGQSIQAALDAATSGDTILVRSGVYNETLTVPLGKRRLRLIGEGPGKTVLDGTGLGPVDGISVQEALTTVEGFTIRHFEANGVTVASDDNVLRHNEVAANGGSGLALDGSRNLIEMNHMRENASHGVEVLNGGYNFLVGNRIAANSAHGVLIHPTGSNALVMENEVLTNGESGISVSGNASWLIGNRTRENHSAGIEIRGAEGVLLFANTSIENTGSGVAVTATGFLMLKNGIHQNGVAGVSVGSDTGNGGLAQALLLANEIQNNASEGLAGKADLLQTAIVQNTIALNGVHAIDLASGTLNRLLANDIGQNQGGGVHMGSGITEHLVDRNTIHRNGAPGLRLAAEAKTNAVRANAVTGNQSVDISAEAPSITENTLDENRCNTSSPPGIGG